MATDGPDPPPCDQEIFDKGETVCVLSGASNAIEQWVKEVAKQAKARVDWHFFGGRANVLHLGDSRSRHRVLEAIEGSRHKLRGLVLRVEE